MQCYCFRTKFCVQSILSDPLRFPDILGRSTSGTGLSALGPPQTRVKKQETRIKKQNGLAHLRFLVCVTPKQKKQKNIAWFEN